MRTLFCFACLAIAFVRNVNAEFELKISSIDYSFNSKDTTILIEIKWMLCNKTKDSIRNLDELWYRDVGLVKYDSLLFGGSKQGDKKPFGIGNTIIKLFQGDTITLPLNFPDAYGEMEDVSTKRFSLSPGECKTGKIWDGFKVLSNKTNSFSIQIDYDTRFQKDGGKSLWRGRLLSNKLSFKVHEDSAGIKQSPVKPTKLK